MVKRACGGCKQIHCEVCVQVLVDRSSCTVVVVAGERFDRLDNSENDEKRHYLDLCGRLHVGRFALCQIVHSLPAFHDSAGPIR